MKRHLLLFFSLLLLLPDAGRAQVFRANLENEAVRRYLSEVSYNSHDDASRVAEYCGSPADRNDWPAPVIVKVPTAYTKYVQEGSLILAYSTSNSFSNGASTMRVDNMQVSIYNLLPGTTYYYCFLRNSTIVGMGRIVTQGQLRMIYAPSVVNVRDIGGWTTADGRRVRYGKIFRGGELNGQNMADDADIAMLRQLGIGAEIDLRAWYEEDHGVSAFGFLSEAATPAGQVPSYLYTADSGQLPEHITQYRFLYRWRLEMEFIVKNLRIGRAVYEHCRHGADRTGYLSLLLEGLLGLDYDSMVKEYELTSFARFRKTKENIDPIIEYIESLEGNTLQQKFRTFWRKKVGVSETDIDYFISAMLEGESNVDTDIAAPQLLQPAGCDATSVNYDILGRQAGNSRAIRGIYISNGRKVVVGR